MARGRNGTEVSSRNAAARRMQAVPYFAAKMPEPMIAKLFKVSESAVRKWAQHPDVRAALGEVSAAVVDATKASASAIAEKALLTLHHLIDKAEDERVRLEAAKTALDRFGYPATSRTENENKNLNIGAIVGFPTEEMREQAAKGVLPGTASEVDDE